MTEGQTMTQPEKAPYFISIPGGQPSVTTERFAEWTPGIPQWFVFIERTADESDDRGPDLYLGPFDDGYLAAVAANESLLVESELTSHLGGTDCFATLEAPTNDGVSNSVILIDHNDPTHTGYDLTSTCRHCAHGIVRIYNSTEERWIAPDAGYDSEGGDGIWRETCPDVEWPETDHEPMEA